MRSLPQFTRSTRWGEFTWVGAIIFEGNFMVSGQFSGGGGQFCSGAIVQGTIFLWGNWPGGNIQKATVQGPLAGGQFSPVAIFWTPNEIFSFCKTLTKIIAKLGIDVKHFCHWKMQMFLNSYFCYLISLSSPLLFLSCLS